MEGHDLNEVTPFVDQDDLLGEFADKENDGKDLRHRVGISALTQINERRDDDGNYHRQHHKMFFTEVLVVDHELIIHYPTAWTPSVVVYMRVDCDIILLHF